MQSMEVLESGIQTTIQDYPGRIGYRAVGYYPAGPMDHLAFRLANRLVGNHQDAAGLEVTLGRVKFRFAQEVDVAVAGAKAVLRVNDEEVAANAVLKVPAGGVLSIGPASDTGFRIYVAVAGGLDVPSVLGSRSTYTMGHLGGIDGRALRKGDVMPIGRSNDGKRYRFIGEAPRYTHDWVLNVVPGPHATPEYLVEEDLAQLFGTSWKIQRSANRTGIRLDARKLHWSRETGGIAGGHPSNILDNAYALGGINLNGDTPVILGPDGPTAGGFVVVGVVCQASLWMLGQMRPGIDSVRFNPVDAEAARRMAIEQDHSFTETLEVM